MTLPKSWRIRIFTVTWLGYAGFYLCRKNFSVIMPILTDEYGYSKTDFASAQSTRPSNTTRFRLRSVIRFRCVRFMGLRCPYCPVGRQLWRAHPVGMFIAVVMIGQVATMIPLISVIGTWRRRFETVDLIQPA